MASEREEIDRIRERIHEMANKINEVDLKVTRLDRQGGLCSAHLELSNAIVKISTQIETWMSNLNKQLTAIWAFLSAIVIMMVVEFFKIAIK
jgi:hypothetical protein